MPRRLSLASGLLLLVAASASAETVDQLLERNAAARGGLEAWRAVQTLTLAGRMDIGRGTMVPFRLEMKRPRRMRLEFEFAKSTAVQTFDGERGWKLMPFLGRSEAIPLSADELKRSAAQADLDGPLLDWKAKGHRVEWVGEETVEGRPAYRLRVKLPSGVTRDLWLDAESALEVKSEATQVVRGQEKRLETFFRDYRKAVTGVVLAHVVETKLEGAPASHALQIESVRINEPLGDDRFGTPAVASLAPAGAAPRSPAR
jgi:hypothetical protein